MHVLDDQTRRFGRVLHYTGLLALVLGATAGYTLAYAPTVQRMARTEMRIDELLLSAQNAPVIREHHQKAASKLEEVTGRIAKVRERVPPSADEGEFLKEVTRIASDEQLTLRDFHPGKGVETKGYTEFEVMLKGQGSFASICSFLDRLSKLKRLSKVRSLTVSSRPAGAYPMEATLILYYGLKSEDSQPAQEVRRG